MAEIGFDNKLYLGEQVKKMKALVSGDYTKVYIEFGEKIIQDKHASRVLPGYDEDIKLEILKRVYHKGEVIFVVSSRDILRGRICGNFKTTYFEETFRTISELNKRGLVIKHVAISLLNKSNPVPKRIKLLKSKLKQLGIETHLFFSIKNYPKKIKVDELATNPFIKTNKRIVVIISPGGGSGKFGICLNQLYHEMSKNAVPYYLKFETFPIHDLPIEHPINLAYMAATADLGDIVARDKRHKGATSYNRDMENYELLHLLARKFPAQGKYLRKISSATSMGINVVSKGITNDEVVQKAAAAEIARRLIRYKFEVAAGKETKRVLTRTRKILRML